MISDTRSRHALLSSQVRARLEADAGPRACPRRAANLTVQLFPNRLPSEENDSGLQCLQWHQCDSVTGTVLDCTPGMRHDNFCDRLISRMTCGSKSEKPSVSDVVQIE